MNSRSAPSGLSATFSPLPGCQFVCVLLTRSASFEVAQTVLILTRSASEANRLCRPFRVKCFSIKSTACLPGGEGTWKALTLKIPQSALREAYVAQGYKSGSKNLFVNWLRPDSVSTTGDNPVGGATGVQYTRRSADGIFLRHECENLKAAPNNASYRQFQKARICDLERYVAFWNTQSPYSSRLPHFLCGFQAILFHQTEVRELSVRKTLMIEESPLGLMISVGNLW